METGFGGYLRRGANFDRSAEILVFLGEPFHRISGSAERTAHRVQAIRSHPYRHALDPRQRLSNQERQELLYPRRTSEKVRIFGTQTQGLRKSLEPFLG